MARINLDVNGLDASDIDGSVDDAWREGMKKIIGDEKSRQGNDGITERGGPGSGHRGHKGRPGEVGGSAADNGSSWDPWKSNKVLLRNETENADKINDNLARIMRDFFDATGIEPSNLVFTNSTYALSMFVSRAMGKKRGYGLDGIEQDQIALDIQISMMGSFAAQADNVIYFSPEPTLPKVSIGENGEETSTLEPIAFDSHEWKLAISHELGHWANDKDVSTLGVDAVIDMTSETIPSSEYLDGIDLYYGQFSVKRREYIADIFSMMVDQHLQPVPSDATIPWWRYKGDLGNMNDWDIQNMEAMGGKINEYQKNLESRSIQPEEPEAFVIFTFAGEALMVPRSELDDLPDDAIVIDTDDAQTE